MRISLRALVGCTLLLLAAFVCWRYLASLRESPVRWVEGGLALSEEVWGQFRSLWDEVQRYVYWILGVYVVVAALTVFFEESNPDRANLWLFTLLLFPYIGLAAYLFFGPNVRSVPHRWRVFRSSRRRSKNRSGRAAPEAADGLERLLEVSSGAVPTRGNAVRILLDGERTFSAIEEALASARRTIHMEYFSVAHDELGTRIKKLLIDRARAGVKVRFLYDAVGSWRIGREYVDELRAAGVQVRAFMPVAFARFRSGLNHRDHRKIVVVDGGVGFVGGLNVGDMYLGRDPRMGRWRDTHLRLEGPAVRELDRVFLELWGQCVGGKANKTESGGPESPSPTPDGGETGGENGKKGPVEGVPVQIASSGPGPTFRAIADGYFQMIASACRRVWITTPYLVPGETLSNALSIAARSGVDVRVIIPSKADHTLVFWASQFNVDTLLRNGVRVFSYKGGFVHAKTMVADSEVASVGTANLDVRSLEINYEVQAFMRSKELAAQLESAFLDDQELCEEESLSGRRNRPLIRKVQAAVGRLWSALL